MASQTRMEKGLSVAPDLLDKTSSRRDHHSRSCPPGFQGPHLQELSGELRELVTRTAAKFDMCIKQLEGFVASNADWNRRVSEQRDSVPTLQRELIDTTQKLVASQVALQQAMATKDGLQQAATAEKARADEMTVQLQISREANFGFVKVNSQLSQALFNLTTLPGVEG